MGYEISCDFRIWTAGTCDMACTDIAILEDSIVKSYGGRIFRLLENTAKEMGLHSTP